MIVPALTAANGASPWGGLRSSWVDAADLGTLAATMVLRATPGDKVMLRGARSVSHRTATLAISRLGNTLHSISVPIADDEFVQRGETSALIVSLIYNHREQPWDWATIDNGVFEQYTGQPLNPLGAFWKDSACSCPDISSPVRVNPYIL